MGGEKNPKIPHLLEYHLYFRCGACGASKEQNLCPDEVEGERFQKAILTLLGMIAQWDWMVPQLELSIGAAPWEQEKCESEHGKGPLFASLGVLSSLG